MKYGHDFLIADLAINTGIPPSVLKQESYKDVSLMLVAFEAQSEFEKYEMARQEAISKAKRKNR